VAHALVACSGGAEAPSTTEPAGTSTGARTGTRTSTSTSTGTSASTERSPTANGDTPASLTRGLLLSYSMFPVVDGQVQPTQGRARVELLIRENGAWRVDSFEDPGSNVFHKAMPFTPPGGQPGILTLSGMSAAVKLWRHGPSGWTSETLWTEEFGGRFNRMRDAEVGNLFGDGDAIAIATHDQGVVATMRWQGGTPQVARIDARPNTFVHEIELGDLNGDGQVEIYATPSDPNDLDGGEQHGEVVRYVPGAPSGGERTVVADLGNRHAKEIWVGDVDGDGRHELYVAVEALTRESGGQVQVVEPVEIRRYDADTPANAGVVIATIQDRLTRFLTVGDVDGDGRREMVAAAFSSGLWLLRPGTNPRSEWATESIDRESSGFEHASLLTDLDGDGRDELYVAADNQGELRRYVWVDGRPRREVIHRRDNPRTAMTWNIVPFDVALAR
jgi:hypothetical protein